MQRIGKRLVGSGMLNVLALTFLHGYRQGVVERHAVAGMLTAKTLIHELVFGRGWYLKAHITCLVILFMF